MGGRSDKEDDQNARLGGVGISGVHLLFVNVSFVELSDTRLKTVRHWKGLEVD